MGSRAHSRLLPEAGKMVRLTAVSLSEKRLARVENRLTAVNLSEKGLARVAAHCCKPLREGAR